LGLPRAPALKRRLADHPVSPNLGVGRFREMDGVELVRSAPARREVRCADCGYGALVGERSVRCPMCHGSQWQEIQRTALLDELAPSTSPEPSARGS
jgi:hypothetical protein